MGKTKTNIFYKNNSKINTKKNINSKRKYKTLKKRVKGKKYSRIQRGGTYNNTDAEYKEIIEMINAMYPNPEDRAKFEDLSLFKAYLATHPDKHPIIDPIKDKDNPVLFDEYFKKMAAFRTYYETIDPTNKQKKLSQLLAISKTKIDAAFDALSKEEKEKLLKEKKKKEDAQKQEEKQEQKQASKNEKTKTKINKKGNPNVKIVIDNYDTGVDEIFKYCKNNDWLQYIDTIYSRTTDDNKRYEYNITDGKYMKQNIEYEFKKNSITNEILKYGDDEPFLIYIDDNNYLSNKKASDKPLFFTGQYTVDINSASIISFSKKNEKQILETDNVSEIDFTTINSLIISLPSSDDNKEINFGKLEYLPLLEQFLREYKKKLQKKLLIIYDFDYTLSRINFFSELGKKSSNEKENFTKSFFDIKTDNKQKLTQKKFFKFIKETFKEPKEPGILSRFGASIKQILTPKKLTPEELAEKQQEKKEKEELAEKAKKEKEERLQKEAAILQKPIFSFLYKYNINKIHENVNDNFTNFIDMLYDVIQQRPGGTVIYSKDYTTFSGLLFVILNLCLDKNDKISKIKQTNKVTHDDIIKAITDLRNKINNIIVTIKDYELICNIFGIEPIYDNEINYAVTQTTIGLKEICKTHDVFINTLVNPITSENDANSTYCKERFINAHILNSNEDIKVGFKGSIILALTPNNDDMNKFLNMLDSYDIKKIITLDDIIPTDNQFANYTRYINEINIKSPENDNTYQITLFDLKRKENSLNLEFKKFFSKDDLQLSPEIESDFNETKLNTAVKNAIPSPEPEIDASHSINILPESVATSAEGISLDETPIVEEPIVKQRPPRPAPPAVRQSPIGTSAGTSADDETPLEGTSADDETPLEETSAEGISLEGTSLDETPIVEEPIVKQRPPRPALPAVRQSPIGTPAIGTSADDETPLGGISADDETPLGGISEIGTSADETPSQVPVPIVKAPKKIQVQEAPLNRQSKSGELRKLPATPTPTTVPVVTQRKLPKTPKLTSSTAASLIFCYS